MIIYGLIVPATRQDTGLPIKDETSETNVRKLYYLFPYLLISFSNKKNNPLENYIYGRIHNLALGSSHFKSFRSSLQSHPLWVTLYIKIVISVCLYLYPIITQTPLDRFAGNFLLGKSIEHGSFTFCTEV